MHDILMKPPLRLALLMRSVIRRKRIINTKFLIKLKTVDYQIVDYNHN